MASTHRVRNRFIFRGCSAPLSLLFVAGVQAQTYFDATGMFPSPMYIEQNPLVINYTNGWRIRGLVVTLTSGRIAPPSSGFLYSNFNLTHQYEISPPTLGFSPVSGSGSGTAQITFDHIAGATEVFVTEMIALDLSGGPAMVRESPTLLSSGGFSRTPSGGGWQVDSFFDVFTEISLDGGQSWSPSQGSTRLRGTPEPGSMLVMGVGAALLAARRRRRPRQA